MYVALIIYGQNYNLYAWTKMHLYLFIVNMKVNYPILKVNKSLLYKNSDLCCMITLKIVK